MKRPSLIITLFWMFSAIVLSQNAQIEELKQHLLEANDDSLRVIYNLKLGMHYETIQFDTAQNFYDAALAIAENTGRNDLKAQVWANIAFAWRYGKGSLKCTDYMKKAIDFYLLTGNDKSLLDAYYNLGTFYGFFEKFPEAIAAYIQAVEVGERVEHNERLGMVYNNLGLMYRDVGDYTKSNLYQFKALAIKEQIKDPTISFTHTNIGQNYAEQGDVANALFHYNTSKRLYKEQKDTFRVALAHNHIGDLYKVEEDYERAILHYDSAFMINSTLGYQGAIANYYAHLGEIAFAKNNEQQALKNYQKALDIIPSKPNSHFPENTLQRTLFGIYAGIISVRLAENATVYTINECEQYAHKMLLIANDVGSLKLKSAAYKALYETHKKNHTEATQYVDLYIETKDSLDSELKQRAIADIQIKYEVEKKALQFELLKGEKQLVEVELQQSHEARKSQRVIIVLLVLGFLLASMLVVLVYRFYKQTKAKNALITKQKEEKEILLQEIHHRVKNNLQIIAGLLDLQLMNMENEAAKNALLDAQSRVKTISSIHRILYQIEDNKTIYFASFANNLVEQISESLSGVEDLAVSYDMTEDISFDVNVAVPLGLILTELLTNAFKYAFVDCESPQIVITLKALNDNKYKLSVCDNGVGFPQGFDVSKSRSMGHRIIRSLSQQLSGELTYSHNDGTCFDLAFKGEKLH